MASDLIAINGHFDTSHLRLDARFVESLKGQILDSMTIVRKEGEDFLRGIIDAEARDTGALLATAHGGSNAYSVYWRVLEAPGPGRDARYGVYQDQGWTDRGKNFHPGKFFMERTEAFGAARLMQLSGAILANNGFGHALANLPGQYLGGLDAETLTGTAQSSRARIHAGYAEGTRKASKPLDVFEYKSARDAFDTVRARGARR